MSDNQQVLSDFHALTDRFTEVVVAAPTERWASPSPCEGWTARDVVVHVIDSQRDFFTRHGLELDHRRDSDPAQLWSAHTSAARTALGDGTILAKEFDSFFGPSTVGETLGRFFNLDLVIHRWDLARALGVDTTFTPVEMDLAEASLAELGDNIYAHGACAPAVEIGDGATRQDQVLARTGRDPRR